MWLETELGRGTTFFFTLPTVDLAQPEPGPSAISEQWPWVERQMRSAGARWLTSRRAWCFSMRP